MNQKSYAWYFTGLSVIPNQKYSMLAIVCSPKMPDKQHKNSVQKKKEHTPAHLFAQVTLSSQVTGTQKTQRESFSPPFTELRPSFQDHSIMAMEQ